MQQYRFIIRHNKAKEDEVKAVRTIAVLRSEMRRSEKRFIFAKVVPPSKPQRYGEFSILVATQKEKDANPKFKDYLKQ